MGIEAFSAVANSHQSHLKSGSMSFPSLYELARD